MSFSMSEDKAITHDLFRRFSFQDKIKLKTMGIRVPFDF